MLIPAKSDVKEYPGNFEVNYDLDGNELDYFRVCLVQMDFEIINGLSES